MHLPFPAFSGTITTDLTPRLMSHRALDPVNCSSSGSRAIDCRRNEANGEQRLLTGLTRSDSVSLCGRLMYCNIKTYHTSEMLNPLA